MTFLRIVSKVINKKKRKKKMDAQMSVGVTTPTITRLTLQDL